MRGAITPLFHTSSYRSAQLSVGTTVPLPSSKLIRNTQVCVTVKRWK
jgi:hypothetical protein